MNHEGPEVTTGGYISIQGLRYHHSQSIRPTEGGGSWGVRETLVIRKECSVNLV